MATEQAGTPAGAACRCCGSQRWQVWRRSVRPELMRDGVEFLEDGIKVWSEVLMSFCVYIQSKKELEKLEIRKRDNTYRSPSSSVADRMEQYCPPHRIDWGPFLRGHVIDR